MKKKIIGMIAAVVIVLGLSLVVYNQMIPNEYAPADDEIALHIRLDAEEDIGLLVFDYANVCSEVKAFSAEAAARASLKRAIELHALGPKPSDLPMVRLKWR